MNEESSLRKRHPIGAPPGTLMHLGEQRSDPVSMQVVTYDRDEVLINPEATVDNLVSHLEDPRLTWIMISGVHDPVVNRAVGECCSIHPLFLEDIMNTMIRPKIEILDGQILVIMKTADYQSREREIIQRQVSLIIGPSYVITFSEEPSNIFDPLLKRIRTKGSLIRVKDADFLGYAVMDILIDRYYHMLDSFEEEIELLENSILDEPRQEHSMRIHRFRTHLITLRKMVWPIREVIRTMKQEHQTVSADNQIYYSDVYDHVIQIMDHIDTLRDVVSGLMDIYMSSISNRMNAVMKVLTVIATIFIPLTFIAGIYGMNFAYMPELMWRWGYFAVLGVMMLVSLGMLWFFRRKQWI